MSGDEGKGAAGEAKGLADQFVRTLGLFDLVTGGVALYWARLAFGAGAAAALPSTGHEFVDVALLACAAAVVGKVVAVLGLVMMALVRLACVRWSHSYRAMGSELGAFLKRSAREAVEGIDPTDVALECVAAVAPARATALAELHESARFAYAAALLAALYATHFVIQRPGERVGLAVAAAALILLVVYVGTALQRQYYAALAAALGAPRAAAQAAAHGA